MKILFSDILHENRLFYRSILLLYWVIIDVNAILIIVNLKYGVLIIIRLCHLAAILIFHSKGLDPLKPDIPVFHSVHNLLSGIGFRNSSTFENLDTFYRVFLRRGIFRIVHNRCSNRIPLAVFFHGLLQILLVRRVIFNFPITILPLFNCK